MPNHFYQSIYYLDICPGFSVLFKVMSVQLLSSLGFFCLIFYLFFVCLFVFVVVKPLNTINVFTF